ncbi:AraC family transcriptional regulator [Pectobacterium aroidearum]|uniref:AraC family transcriptional regulator n=1 Tax=Pectobacterium aroidearum TaxID=1201031 RepID=UPI0032EE308A
MKNRFLYLKNNVLEDVTFLDASIQDFYYKKHSHEEYAIGLINTGKIGFNCRDGMFHIPGGGLMQLNPGDPHEGTPDVERGYDYWMLYIPASQMAKVVSDYCGFSRFKTFNFSGNVSRNTLLRERYVNFAAAMLGDRTADAALEQSFADLIHCLCNLNLGEGAGYHTGRVDNLIRRAEDYIRQNIHTSLSIDEVSQVAGISKYHFMRMFKAQVGVTPYQYIINCKVNKIKLDIDSGYSAEKTFSEESFFDQSHFNKRFREIYGVTPKGYQHAIRKGI